MAQRKLKDVRIDSGLDTQQKLADAAGLTKVVIWKAENGKAISYTSARKIIRALQKAGVAIAEVDEIEWNVSGKR